MCVVSTNVSVLGCVLQQTCTITLGIKLVHFLVAGFYRNGSAELQIEEYQEVLHADEKFYILHYKDGILGENC